MPHRPLGASGIDVSVLALGSWRTYERIGRAEGIAVMRTARERGIAFLDDARYDDETGTAPIRTGYSEVIFGELFRAAGWKRDEVVVANKLWWEFWPGQSAAEELDASLERMGLDYLDLVYSWATVNGPPVEEVVSDVGRLISSGRVRAWGTGNWEWEEHRKAALIADRMGVPRPCAAQVPYNPTLRAKAEGAEVAEALDASGAAVVASFVLHGGVLTGKYVDRSTPGRISGKLDEPALRDALRTADDLTAVAAELATTPAPLAVAFALANEHVGSVLFGATSPAQLDENARAIELLDRLTPTELDAL